MGTLNLHSIQDTKLWRHLNAVFPGDDRTASVLASDLIGICEEAADRMRAFPSLHRQFTLHDEKHLLRVTELMGMVVPEDVLRNVLNPIEITLLILSAFFHDQGMVLEAGELTGLQSNREYRIFQDNWEIDHPNVRELREQIICASAANIETTHFRSIEQELSAAMLTNFVRQTHGRRSADFVRERYGNDPRWTAAGSDLSELVARLALSHVKPSLDLRPDQGFRFDDAVGTYRVNMVYLGIVLRIADILDFDRDRTPDSLYRTIDFTNRISLREWEKHRSVEGWIVNSSMVQYTLRCEHPEYQRAAYEFMDWIDLELSDAASIARLFPAEFARYVWNLPSKVDRSRIEPKNRSYIYRDLEFVLSRDEIVKLLMTRELYGGPWLCVRELLQNSLDALRFRVAVHQRDLTVRWDQGRIHFAHYLKSDGTEILRCEDNGIGMDLPIIERFLTNVGRSYYRSPEFEQERLGLKAAGADFEPCAQFGIGFMSVFMLGDRISIETKRDYGSVRGVGDPLVVEINGLGGMAVIRPGKTSQQPGTAIEVILRPTKRPRNRLSDDVRLISVLKGYALSTEFPITGECTIKGLAGGVAIPPTAEMPITPFEEAGVRDLLTLSQKYADIDPLLGGIVRASFLVDETGKLVLESKTAKWRKPIVGDALGGVPFVEYESRKLTHRFWRDGQTCLDGILVAGDPGRTRDERSNLGSYANPIHAGGSSFLLDIRGRIKPPLTPARVPPRGSLGPELEGKWASIADFAYRTEARIWEQILARCFTQDDPLLFWQLATIYGAPVRSMRKRAIWAHLILPFTKGDSKTTWVPVHSIGKITMESVTSAEMFRLVIGNGSWIAAPPQMIEWQAENRGENVNWRLKRILLSMCAVQTDESEISFVPFQEPENDSVANENDFVSVFTPPIALPYRDTVRTIASVVAPEKTVNCCHPLIRSAIDARFIEERTDVQTFATAMVWRICDPPTLSVVRGTKAPRFVEQYVGSLFNAVHWNTGNQACRPPYIVRTEDGNLVEITAELLSSWADAQIQEDF
jgi:hypothetical protein